MYITCAFLYVQVLKSIYGGDPRSISQVSVIVWLQDHIFVVDYQSSKEVKKF